MRTVSIVVLTLLANLLLIGCTPVNVSLNSEFGLSINKSPDKTPPPAPSLVISQQPPYANLSTSSSLNFSGTCENLERIQVNVNKTVAKTVLCENGVWLADLNVSTEDDGEIDVAFIEHESQKSLQKVLLIKDTKPPEAKLNYSIPNINNFVTGLVDVNESSDTVYYRYKIGLTSSTDCKDPRDYLVDYIPVRQDSSKTLTDEGSYKLCLIGKDAFENEQPYDSATEILWQLDTTSPELTLKTSTSTTYVNKSTFTSFAVSVNCSEIGRPVNFKAVDKNLSEVTDTKLCLADTKDASLIFNLTNLADGPISFQSEQTDLAGNTTIYTALTLTKDTVDPVFSSSVVNDGTYYADLLKSPNITWSTATDADGSGIFEYQIGFGLNDSEPSHTPFYSVGNTQSRQHTFSTPLTENTDYFTFVQVFDKAGNSSIIVSDGWKPDVTGPSIASIDDGSFGIPGVTSTISWSAATDVGSGINKYQVAIGSDPSNPDDIVNWHDIGFVTSVSITNSKLILGETYYASVRAVDNVGNTGPARTGNGFTIKPTILALASNSGSYAAIMTNGDVIAWGDKGFGGDNEDVPTPLQPAPLKSDSLKAVAIKSSYKAYAVLTRDGSVYAWGLDDFGGNKFVSNEVDGVVNPVERLYSNNHSFAAIRKDGSVEAWGDSEFGGFIPSYVKPLLDGIDDEHDVLEIVSTKTAYAAIRRDRSVVTWGSSEHGGVSSSVANKIDGSDPIQFSPVVEISSTASGFIARRRNGSLVTWGYFSGVLPTNPSVASKIDGSSVEVTGVFTNGLAVAALRKDNSVITWGEPTNGGYWSELENHFNTSTPEVDRISANLNAFAAIRKDGSVITWGNSAYGGNSSAVALDNVSTISATNFSFAALLNDGSVVPWGSAEKGGAFGSSQIAQALNGSTTDKKATAIVGTVSAFAALRKDGSVITWGDAERGGNSISVQNKINGSAGAIVTLYSNAYSFIAVYGDGRFVTWGNDTFGGDSRTVNPD